MKHIVLLLVVYLPGCFYTNAQDLIYLKNQKKPMPVKVTEIGLEEVKYRLLGNTSGPVLVLPDTILTV